MTKLEQAILAAAKAIVAVYADETVRLPEGFTMKESPKPQTEGTPVAMNNGVGSHCGKQLLKSKFCKDGFEAYFWCGECKKNFNKDFEPAPYKKRA